ncbi:hypothetical protein K420107F6_14010 [Lactonifactor longoviformis]
MGLPVGCAIVAWPAGLIFFACDTPSKHRENLRILKEASFGWEEYHAGDKDNGWFSESDG